MACWKMILEKGANYLAINHSILRFFREPMHKVHQSLPIIDLRPFAIAARLQVDGELANENLISVVIALNSGLIMFSKLF